MAMKLKNLLILISMLFFASISANLFASSFAGSYGFSAEGMARGNAMTATVNDWSSVYYNIGGLGKTRNITGTEAPKSTGGEMTLKLRKAEGEGEAEKEPKKEIYPNQFAISVLATMPKLDLKFNTGKRYNKSTGSPSFYYPEKTTAAKMNPYGFVVIGGVLDINNVFKLPDFISSARLGIGMGMNWDFSLVKVNDIDPRTHDFLKYGREVQRAMILIGAGFGLVNDFIGFGAGVNAAFGGKGKLYMEAQMTGDPQIPIGQTTMDLSISPGALAGIYISPGQLAPPIKGLELGVSYRQETMLKIDPFDAAAGILGGAIYMNLMLAIFDYYTPHTVTHGIAYTRAGATVSFDIDYEMWSKTTFSKVVKYHYPMTPKFNDTLTYKVGLKYEALSWLAVMVGYSYVPTVLDDKAGTMAGIRVGTMSINYVTGLFNFLDNDKHCASLGLKFTVPKMWRLNGQIVITLAYQFQYLVPKKVEKNGFNFDYLSQTFQDPMQAYLLNPSYKYGGMNHSVMMEIGMRI